MGCRVFDDDGGCLATVEVNNNAIPEEVIIIVGTEQNNPHYGNKLMFAAQAVREIKHKYPNDKYVNIVIFKEAYTKMQLDIIKRDAKRWNNTVYFKQINYTEELIGYINSGDATIDRRKRKIKKIIIFAHRSGYLKITDKSVSAFYHGKGLYRSIINDIPWDLVLWNENGAYAPPTHGSTPKRLPTKMYIFEKNKEPVSKK